MVHKKWWFWVLMALATIVTIGVIGSSEGDTATTNANSETSQVIQSQKEEVNYEVVDLRQMLDDLDANALKAEKTYQNKYVEVAGKITNFDSDGSYISIEPINADAWNFDTVMCKINNDAQRDFLMEKEVGDIVTVKGQITFIGELLGYTIKIVEVA